MVIPNVKYRVKQIERNVENICSNKPLKKLSPTKKQKGKSINERDIALIDELRTTENSLVEFKQNNCDAKLIAKLCSALSNAARIDNKDFAYVLWGIDDVSHEVIDTSFNPEGVKAESNTVLQLWLAQRLLRLY